ASVRSLSTRLVAFDTAVVDLTDELDDPVDVLFGVQLGGGTDIAGALTYCAARVTRPRDTVLVLVSDLFEGGDPDEMLRVAASLVASGVTVVVLLALSDEGAPPTTTTTPPPSPPSASPPSPAPPTSSPT